MQDNSSQGVEEIGLITSCVDTQVRNQEGIQLFVDINTNHGKENNNNDKTKDQNEEFDHSHMQENLPKQAEHGWSEYEQEHLNNTLEQAGASPLRRGRSRNRRKGKKIREKTNPEIQERKSS
ncbi:hypothetical protein HAX54_004893 [Datura stramonium]|uniref:Uncharacterized protein n=1 Tax=Datura stramonium TaxID=4076 RepID=A0ABS8T8Y5_DATST|nr:hypothetical protein [Datura stramonium]